MGLLERESDLTVIEAALASARAGRGAAVLVRGPAGIGKTALLEAARERALAQRLAVLSASGRELESSFSFGVVRSLLHGARRRRGLAPAVVAVLEARPAGAATPVAGDPLAAALAGLLALVTQLAAERPLTLLVDDAHWADEASQRLLAFLAPRLDALPVALVVAARPTGAHAAPALDALAAEPSVRRLRPRPLERRAVASILASALAADPDEAFLAAVLATTGGNPFLVHALARHIAAEGIVPGAREAAMVAELDPHEVTETITRRLGDLPRDARGLARALAILEHDENRSVAAALAGVGAGAIDALLTAEVVAPGRALRFSHPLVRRAVYADLAESERVAGHRSAAALLHERGASPETVAGHLHAIPGTGDPWVVERLLEAAALARARAVPSAGISALRRALAEPPAPSRRADVLLELAELELWAADPAAERHLEQALELVEEPPTRARILAKLGSLRFYGGDGRGARAALAAAAKAAADGDHDVRLGIAAELIELDRFTCEPMRPLAELGVDPALDLREEAASSPQQRMFVAAHAQRLVCHVAHVAEAVGLAERALSIPGMRTLEGLQSRPAANHLGVLLLAERVPQAEGWLDDALAEAERRSERTAQSMALTLRSYARLMRGAVGGARDDGLRAIELGEGTSLSLLRDLTRSFVLQARVEIGELEQAEAHLADDGLDGPVRESFATNMGLVVRGRLHRLRGRLAEARADLEEAGRRFGVGAMDTPTLGPWRSELALVLHALGEPERAGELAADEARLARVAGLARSEGIALRVGALVTTDEAACASGLEASRALLAGTPDELEHARTLLAIARLELAAGRRADARDPLRLAFDAAGRAGATALAAEVREELRRSGARVRGPLRGPAALSPAELRVARLACEGATNGEIARRLVVVPRTVELHLTAAYRKLGVAGRAELVLALTDLLT